MIPDGLITEWRDPSGTVGIMNVPYHRDWIGRTLISLEEALGIRAAFVVRFGNGLLPNAETVVQEGDLIYAAALSADMAQIADLTDISPTEGN